MIITIRRDQRSTKSAGQRCKQSERQQPRKQDDGGNGWITVRHHAHQSQPGNEIEPVAKFRNDLSPPQAPKRTIAAEKLNVC